MKENERFGRPDIDDCTKCGKPLLHSWMWVTFHHPVCDPCTEPEGEHKLLTRTEIKKEYLLKDEDLDLRQPPLRFLAMKNPNNPRYGDMKLYVKKQVVERMLAVHGSFYRLARRKEILRVAREKREMESFNAKVKEMRATMRGMLAARAKAVRVHRHDFDEEQKVEGEEDKWEKKCKTCEYKEVFEKM